MKKLLCLAVMGLMAMSFGAATVSATDYYGYGKNRWSLFGDAEPINQPVALTSVCLPLPCDFSTLTFSGVSFKVKKYFTFADLTELSTYYNRTDDDCGAGSPRFQVSIDTDGDGDADGNLFIYIGPYPNFTGCPASWQSTGNLIASPDLRFDTSQFSGLGGTFYDSYANALSILGSFRVLGISLVVDSGWNGPATGGDGEQTILIANTSVNGNKLTIDEDNHGY